MLARTLLLFLITGVLQAQSTPSLQNPSFESPSATGGQVEGWQVSTDQKEANGFSIQLDKSSRKEGSSSLVVENTKPAKIDISQKIFLPAGSTWKVSVWVKGEAIAAKPKDGDDSGLEIETPSGNQGLAALPTGSFDWQQKEIRFRVPSPGRVHIALLANTTGKFWFDDVHIEPWVVTTNPDVHITGTRLSKRPIDLKQGGQFIEPLCHMMPSMLAQQVEGDSFEDEVPCDPTYKRGMDWAQRPWYQDGAVHDATYSYDSANAFNGMRSQKIELPMPHARGGISQDGFYLKQGLNYKIHLHMKGLWHVPVWASLRGDGGLIAGPVMLGHADNDWKNAEAVLRANRTTRDATLTIEFEGPGTLWLDRVYFIGDDAVLGLWRPDVVAALKAMNPGIIRFGGSMIEVYEWDKSIGPVDQRVPFTTGPWGGIDPNFVGIEEFTQLTRYVGAEPLICVRWSGKTPADAAAEVEYMNGGVDTKWGKLRAQNGHAEPYHVKYWQIGNEVGGSQYDESVRAFAEAMRKVDPSIKMLSSFPSAETLGDSGGYLDYLCPHHYDVANLPGEDKDFKFLADQISHFGNGRDVRVAVTEWNTTAGEMGLTRGMLLTLGNALSNSRYQNLFHRYADLVEIGIRSNLSDSFGSGMIQPGVGWMYLSPTYYSQTLYQRAAGTYPLKINRDSKNSWEIDDPDLSATLSPDGKTLRIFVVNSTAETEKVQFHLDDLAGSATGGEAFVLKDKENSLDSEAMNSQNDPERITTSSQALNLKGKEFPYSFSPYSVNLLELKLSQ